VAGIFPLWSIHAIALYVGWVDVSLVAASRYNLHILYLPVLAWAARRIEKAGNP